METVNLTTMTYNLELLVGKGFGGGSSQNMGLVFSRYMRLQQMVESSGLTDTRFFSEKDREGEEPILRGFITTSDQELNRALKLVEKSGAEVCAIVGDEVSELARLKAMDFGWDIL